MLCWRSFVCCSRARSNSVLALKCVALQGLEFAGTALAVLFFLGAAVGSTAVKKGLLGLRACLPLRLPCLVTGSVWVTLLDDGLVDGALGALSRIGAA